MPPSTDTLTPTGTPTLASRLHELISAAFSAIWVQTAEPHEAAREIIDLCHDETWRLARVGVEVGVGVSVDGGMESPG